MLTKKDSKRKRVESILTLAKERERKVTCRVSSWCYVVLGFALYLWDAVERVLLVSCCCFVAAENAVMI